ncbi:eotaxin-like isoform X1 [Alosa alosa]|uniref:eotaxin-like n=1 Tax=Alosa sapidissima TaxID=34773 RepID=UPI001C0A0E64|nr:eotaxin-like [Alosa sapidissima]XP_048122844.1 eotaxin-like isoform X1 [Alosa alosa]
MRYTLVIAILGALLVAAIALPRRQFRRPTKVSTLCCTRVNNAVIRNITSARAQSALHPCVEAIVFTTNDGKQFCTNPKAPWVPDVLRALIMTN